MGDCEHLRDTLQPNLRKELQANTLYWITDRTPHESLPMTEGAMRQFFRLVTSDVDLWYEQHSTPNPLGVQPNGKIITENKFENYLLK
jgi:hypothetical protein